MFQIHRHGEEEALSLQVVDGGLRRKALLCGGPAAQVCLGESLGGAAPVRTDNRKGVKAQNLRPVRQEILQGIPVGEEGDRARHNLQGLLAGADPSGDVTGQLGGDVCDISLRTAGQALLQVGCVPQHQRGHQNQDHGHQKNRLFVENNMINRPHIKIPYTMLSKNGRRPGMRGKGHTKILSFFARRDNIKSVHVNI